MSIVASTIEGWTDRRPGPPFQCRFCKGVFSQSSSLQPHSRESCQHKHTFTGPYECYLCLRTCKRQYDLQRHIETVHGDGKIECPRCSKTLRKDQPHLDQLGEKCTMVTKACQPHFSSKTGSQGGKTKVRKTTSDHSADHEGFFEADWWRTGNYARTKTAGPGPHQSKGGGLVGDSPTHSRKRIKLALDETYINSALATPITIPPALMPDLSSLIAEQRFNVLAPNFRHFGYTFEGPLITSACKLCGLIFEERDFVGLIKHIVEMHWKATYYGPYKCDVCVVSFAHERDLQHHLWSVRKQSQCGYSLDHKCTGHHPPSTMQNFGYMNPARAEFIWRVRQWEQSQVQAFQNSVDDLFTALSNARSGVRRPSSVGHVVLAFGNLAIQTGKTYASSQGRFDYTEPMKRSRASKARSKASKARFKASVLASNVVTVEPIEEGVPSRDGKSSLESHDSAISFGTSYAPSSGLWNRWE